MSEHKGIIVKTKTGKIGRVFYNEEKVKGKVIVHIMEQYELTGKKLLCKPDTLKTVGYFD